MYFINHMCILCLNKKQLVLINKSLFEDVKYLFPECAINNSQLPLHICKNCEVAIKSFLIFKKRCLKSYYYWKKYLKILQNASDDNIYGTVCIEPSRKRKRKDDDEICNVEETDHISENIEMTVNENSAQENKIFTNVDFLGKIVDFEEISSWYDQNFQESENREIEHKTKTTAQISNLKAENKQDEDKEQICQICNESITDLQSHLNFHLEQSSSGCIVCEKKPVQLGKHIKRHMGVFDKFQCEICWKKFMYNFALNDHMVTAHASVHEFACELCPQKFSNYNLFNSHVKSHKKDTPTKTVLKPVPPKEIMDIVENPQQKSDDVLLKKYILYPTDVTIEDKKIFKQLMRNCRPDPIPNFTCKICREYVNGDLKVVESHIEFHLAGSKTTCSICSYDGRKKYLLMLHMKRKHIGVRDLLCFICNTYYSTMSNLTKHFRTIHCESMMYHCALCQHAASCINHMKKHVEVHLKENTTCSICKLQMSSAENVKIHLQKFHKHKQCIHCEQLFEGKEFKDHLALHTNLKTCKVCYMQISVYDMTKHEKLHYFKCNQCFKELRSQEQLDKHYYLNHFKHTYCQLCNKNLDSADIAYEHYIEHLIVNTLACMKCENKFVNVFEYLSHMRQHQMFKSFNCRICNKRFTRRIELRRHILTNAHMRNENDSNNDMSDEDNIAADDDDKK